jgi:hypothetical protein
VLLSAVGDVCAGRRIGFGCRRADLAARFARSRPVEETAVVASWIGGALADLGLLRVVLPAGASERERAFALADAPLHGARMIAELGLPAAAADIVRWHAEHDDGTGIPDRLRWDGIPADAVGVGIAGAFLALLEDETEARPAAEALVALLAESGRRFAVEHVRAFRSFIASDVSGWDAPLPLALPTLDEDVVLAALAGWLEVTDERARGRDGRLASLAAAASTRLGLDEERVALALSAPAVTR